MTDTAILIEIPPVYCPIPAAIHPAARRLEERGLLWMRRYGFCADETLSAMVAGSNSGEAMALVLPHADEDRLQLFTDWCYLGFLMDDLMYRMGDGGGAGFAPLAGRLLRTLENPRAGLLGDDTFAAAIVDVADRLQRLLTPVQHRRWTDLTRRWFLGTIWEKAVAKAGTPLTLNEYAALRMDSCAGPLWFGLCEFARAAEISDREMDAPPVRALNELCWLLVGWDNDLFSDAKERWLAERAEVAVDHAPTLVSVLAAEESLEPAEALRRAATVRDHLMSLFVRLRAQVLPSASPELRAYLGEAGHMIRGNLDYYLRPRTTRYSDPDGRSPGALRFTGGFVDSPPGGVEEPLPLPSIAWWWEQLTG
ncbi:hypothetical protein [Actinomadura sp. DC4]|uniref:terpene synthase family protein n=1 Tax=Actinomadura sp. DC4 TaxID=3055069 RepID=UPI0025B0A7D6|nr:hypothetical protein [Actinomadura sp. DC4]MDN3354422.1 hypothetical protein [Actinomadura sp. DC4]